MRHALMILAIGLSLSACGTTEAPKTTGSDNAASTAPAQPAEELFTPVKAADGTPDFTLAWSFYTSWSALASADAFHYIDIRDGWQGEFEVKYGVDVILQRLDYVPSFGVYADGTADAVTITNTDALAVAFERHKGVGDATVAVFPTSWSHGADKILVEKSVATWAGLAGVPVHGAELSVTQYLFWRGCTLNNTADRYGKDYTFTNLDPVVGAPQFAGSQNPEFQAFGGWSPETFIVLDGRNGDESPANDVIDLFNSSQLGKYEITDMMVVGQSVLEAPGGIAGVQALAAAMDAMVSRTHLASKQGETYRAISVNFNDVEIGYIEKAMELSPMLSPLVSSAVLDSPEMHANMPLVVDFSLAHDLIPSATAVPIGWGTASQAPDAVLRFDTSLVH